MISNFGLGPMKQKAHSYNPIADAATRRYAATKSIDTIVTRQQAWRLRGGEGWWGLKTKDLPSPSAAVLIRSFPKSMDHLRELKGVPGKSLRTARRVVLCIAC